MDETTRVLRGTRCAVRARAMVGSSTESFADGRSFARRAGAVDEPSRRDGWMGAENAWHAFAFIRARVVVFVVVVRGTRHRSNDIACVCSPRCPRTTSCGSNAPWTRGTSTEAGTRFREWNHSFATPNARRDDDAGCVRTKGADEARRWVDTSTRAGSGPSSRPSVESVIRRGISLGVSTAGVDCARGSR